MYNNKGLVLKRGKLLFSDRGRNVLWFLFLVLKKEGKKEGRGGGMDGGRVEGMEGWKEGGKDGGKEGWR